MLDPDGPWQIILLVVLLFGSAFFSASETALMSLSKIRLRHLEDAGVKNAELVNKLLEHPNRLLGAILVGNNLVNIGASALATSIIMKLTGASGVLWATLMMTVLILIFGEITPKSLAALHSEKWALFLGPFLKLVVIILTPVTRIVTFITDGLIRLTGNDPKEARPFITAEELRTILTVSQEEGVLEGDESKMISNVFDFGDSQAKDAMTTRTDMIVVDETTSFDDVVELFRAEQYSRIPVYQDTIDDIIGVLYIKDLILNQVTRENFNILELMREPYFTYEFKKTKELFEDMRDKRIPIAIVLDEYGGTSGIVTMEDLVEEIVGDISDEYDIQDMEIIEIRENEYVVDGSTRIDDVNETLGTDIQSEDFDSIGGYVLGEIGDLPYEGEIIEKDGITFKAEKVDKNRIERLRIHI